jgi:hypothetical protein
VNANVILHRFQNGVVWALSENSLLAGVPVVIFVICRLVHGAGLGCHCAQLVVITTLVGSTGAITI